MEQSCRIRFHEIANSKVLLNLLYIASLVHCLLYIASYILPLLYIASYILPLLFIASFTLPLLDIASYTLPFHTASLLHFASLQSSLASLESTQRGFKMDLYKSIFLSHLFHISFRVLLLKALILYLLKGFSSLKISFKTNHHQDCFRWTGITWRLFFGWMPCMLLVIC